jgi:hypothetical protein
VLTRWAALGGRIEDPARRPPDAAPVKTLLFSFSIGAPGSATPAAAGGDG